MPKRKATVRTGWRPDAASSDEAPGAGERPVLIKRKPAPRVQTNFPTEETPDGGEPSTDDDGFRGGSPGDDKPDERPVDAQERKYVTKPAVRDAVGVIDKRSRWAPGQWEAWKAYVAKEEAANASLPRAKRKLVQQIVEEFNDAHEGRGWHRKTVHSIRAQRSRVGEADPTYRDSRLSQLERRRALELFQQNGRSWAMAVELFNQETGRNLTRGALMQSTRRMSPTSLPQDLLSFSSSAASGPAAKRTWTKTEVQALIPLAYTKADDLHAAYISFLETMKAQNPAYVPRTYQGFLTELSLVRRTRVEKEQRDA